MALSMAFGKPLDIKHTMEYQTKVILKIIALFFSLPLPSLEENFDVCTFPKMCHGNRHNAVFRFLMINL